MQPLRMGMFDMAVPTNPKIGSPPVYMLRARRRAAPTQPQFIYYWRPWRSWLVGTNWSEPHAGLIGVPQSGTSQACPGERNIKWSPYVHEKRGWDMAWDVVVTCAAYHACCGALEVRGAEALQPRAMGIYHADAFAPADGKPIYRNAMRSHLFFWEPRRAWQIGPDIGPYASVAASARKQYVAPHAPPGVDAPPQPADDTADHCPDGTGHVYYALRPRSLNMSFSALGGSRWALETTVSVRCIGTLAAEDDSPQQPPQQQQQQQQQDTGVPPQLGAGADAGEGISATKAKPATPRLAPARGRCCAVVEVAVMLATTRMMRRAKEHTRTPGGSHVLHATARAAARGDGLSGQYRLVAGQRTRTSTRPSNESDPDDPGRPIYLSLATKLFLFYWPPFGAWRLGIDWQAPHALATSVAREYAHCPARANHWVAASHGLWNESVALNVSCGHLKSAPVEDE